jgi:hypothetical protein
MGRPGPHNVAGDMNGYAVWKQIVKAVEEVRRTDRPAEEALH